MVRNDCALVAAAVPSECFDGIIRTSEVARGGDGYVLGNQNSTTTKVAPVTGLVTKWDYG